MSSANEPTNVAPTPLVSAPAISPARARALGEFALLFAVTIAAYLPAMQGGFIWDDNAHVPRPDLRTVSGLMRIWFEPRATQQYYPVASTFYWFQHKLWGDDTLGYHLVNVLLHAANACLVLGLLRKLAVPGALLAAAIFAVHPVHVESVAWISEQKNTLSALFYLSAMWVYLDFDATRKPGNYWGALALFALALFSKTVTASLPAALLVIFWWRRGTLSWNRDVLPLLPFFLIGAVSGLFTAYIERTQVGAAGGEFELPFVERFLLASRVPWFYAWKLAWPTNLMFVYPRWTLDATSTEQWVYPVLTFATLAALVFAAWRWSYRGTLAGVFFFLGTLFPVLGFLNVYPFRFSYVADHFQYLASLGLIVFVASGLTLFAQRLPQSLHAAAKVAGALLVGLLAFLTWQQSHIYGDVVTLYRTTLDRNPNAWMAHSNLGVELADGQRVDEAIPHYYEALRLNPDAAEIHYNLANALVAQGKRDQAIAEYREALRLHPDYLNALENLGATLQEGGDKQGAVDLLESSVKLAPDDPDAHARLGAALMTAGRVQEAAPHFVKAIELDPECVRALSGLSNALLATGNAHEAMGPASQAIQIDPEYAPAYNSLGTALAHLTRYSEAAQYFEAAIHFQPKMTLAYGNLMGAYAASGRTAEAIIVGQKGLELARADGNVDLVAQFENALKQLQATAANTPATNDAAQPDNNETQSAP